MAAPGRAGAARGARGACRAAFPRLGERDPLKVLGVGAGASYDEVALARDCLLEAYGGEPEAREAIELAHDKVIQVGPLPTTPHPTPPPNRSPPPPSSPPLPPCPGSTALGPSLPVVPRG